MRQPIVFLVQSILVFQMDFAMVGRVVGTAKGGAHHFEELHHAVAVVVPIFGKVHINAQHGQVVVV